LNISIFDDLARIKFILMSIKSIFVFSILLAFTACNKSGGLGDNYVSMEYNGKKWTMNDGASAFVNKSSKLLAISGSTENGTLIISVPNADRIGSYNLVLNDETTSFVFTEKSGGAFKIYSISKDFNKSRGTLEITRIRSGRDFLDYAEGTFSGVAYSNSGDSIIIQNGKFRQLN
jgi:hypothetical protein